MMETNDAQVDEAEKSLPPRPGALDELATASLRSAQPAGPEEIKQTEAVEYKGSETADESGMMPFAQHVHSYINEYIRFADQKASILLGVITAVLALLHRAGLLGIWVHWETGPFARQLLSLAAFWLLVLGALLSLFTVLPRLRAGPGEGLVFWGAIGRFDTPGDYARQVLALRPLDGAQALLEHCHALARICSAKYCALSLALYLGGVGLVSGGLLALTSL